MRKRILAYRKFIDVLLENPDEINNIDDVIDEHLVQIGFFQHERLVHLLVTLAFAFLTVITTLVMIFTTNYTLAILALLLIVLLVPYILHYYILENEVQKMYNQYDKMLEIKRRVSQTNEQLKL